MSSNAFWASRGGQTTESREVAIVYTGKLMMSTGRILKPG